MCGRHHTFDLVPVFPAFELNLVELPRVVGARVHERYVEFLRESEEHAFFMSGEIVDHYAVVVCETHGRFLRFYLVTEHNRLDELSCELTAVGVHTRTVR